MHLSKSVLVAMTGLNWCRHWGPVLCNVLFSSARGRRPGDQLPGADTGNYYGCDAGYMKTQHIQTTVYRGDGLLMIPCVLPSAPIMVLSFVIVWAKHYISCEAI